MKIGFDISQTGRSKAGCGYFAHAIIQAMLDAESKYSFDIYPSFGDFYFDARMPLRNPYENPRSCYRPRHFSLESARRFWTSPDLESALGRPALLHSNNFWCPTQLKTSRLVYTFYDAGFAINPAWAPDALRVGCFKCVFKSALVADWVVAISQASRAHYLQLFPHFPPERIRVIYPCSRFADANRAGVRPKALSGLAEGGFWLSVGTIEPRKNQRRLAEAYARYRAQGGAAMPLVFAGGKGWLMDDFQSHLQTLGIAESVLMTGYVSDDELIWLYRNCYANLYPSLFEGFGLPVLEGMQFGAVTVCSNTTSLPEVAGDAAWLIDPEDTAQWAAAMLRLAASPAERATLRSGAKRQAAGFNWQASATQLLALYEEALNHPKRSGQLS